jgi:hypothetical protein
MPYRDRSKRIEYGSKWREKNSYYMEDWRAVKPDYERHRHLKRTYGLHPGQKEQMLASQNGQCAICKVSEPGSKKGWSVDHDHATGKVRSILCHHCNLVLGNAKDDPSLLREAANYIEAHNGRP